MRIAFVLRHITDKGSSKYAVEVIRRMLKKGHEIHVFANKWDDIEGVHFHKIPVFTGNFLIQEISLILLSTIIVNLQRHKFDAVYSQPGRFFSPDVAGVHICATGGGSRPKGVLNGILYIIEKFNLGRAKKIIAVSNSIKNELARNYSIPEEKITVIHNGVDLSRFSRDKSARLEIRKKFGAGKNEVLLLFVGNPFGRKGLEYAIRALPIAKDSKLLVIGRDNIEPYLKLAERLKAEKRILYLKFAEDISDYFSAADIFVFPTLYEPFGLVITEAMASGLPVIVSKCAGAAELIDDGKEGLLLDNPRNEKEIAEKINRLIKDKKLRNKIVRQARNVAERNSWDEASKKWLRVFEEMRTEKQKQKM